MKVIKCDQCSKIISEEETFFLCECNPAELIENEVIGKTPVVIGKGSHFCTVGCAIDKLTQEWRKRNESN